MQLADRMGGLPAYLFADINNRIAVHRRAGRDVISLGAGDPDLPPPPHIIASLEEAVRQAPNHRYPPYDGIEDLRESIAGWYNRRFGVVLDPADQVVPLIGSKEGIAHVALALLDPGDIALVPSPGYPVYQIGTLLAGGKNHLVPLYGEDGFLPRLRDVPADVARQAKLLWLNYPNNPTSSVVSRGFFDEVVLFARDYGVAVLHDNAYSDVAYDGYVPPSFLETPGAMEVGVEFHSLSKTFNMPGWRIGMVVGNPVIVQALQRIKTNIDSGIFLPIQIAAAAALSGPQDWLPARNAIYQSRRDLVVTSLRKLGCVLETPKAALYVWARTPGDEPSMAFATRVLDEAAVWVTPGVSYGPHGEGYFRVSLTVSDARLTEALARLERLG